MQYSLLYWQTYNRQTTRIRTKNIEFPKPVRASFVKNWLAFGWLAYFARYFPIYQLDFVVPLIRMRVKKLGCPTIRHNSYRRSRLIKKWCQISGKWPWGMTTMGTGDNAHDNGDGDGGVDVCSDDDVHSDNDDVDGDNGARPQTLSVWDVWQIW